MLCEQAQQMQHAFGGSVFRPASLRVTGSAKATDVYVLRVQTKNAIETATKNSNNLQTRASHFRKGAI